MNRSVVMAGPSLVQYGALFHPFVLGPCPVLRMSVCRPWSVVLDILIGSSTE